MTAGLVAFARRVLHRGSDTTPAPRPDYTKIALLEYDLFGVQPKPGTVAAAVIGMRSLAGAIRSDAGRPDA